MFLNDLKSAIEDEYKSYYLYKSMLPLTNDPTWQAFIKQTMGDEKSHYEMLQQLYYMLTGQFVQNEIQKPTCTDLKVCAKQAVEDELAATKKYKMLLLNVPIEEGQNSLFIAMLDEMEHAIRFSTIYNAL